MERERVETLIILSRNTEEADLEQLTNKSLRRNATW